jgi:uncharacterized protein YeaO (DUF488 family)
MRWRRGALCLFGIGEVASRESPQTTRFQRHPCNNAGIKKDALKADSWLKNVAPSAELRQWFGHDPAKWNDFRHKYFSELKANLDGRKPIVEAELEGTVTLLYSANDEAHNNAVALREFLRDHLAGAK